MNMRFLSMAVLLAAGHLGLAGCAQTKVTLVQRDAPYQDVDVAEPDFIVVKRFAVTADQARQVTTLVPQSAVVHTPSSEEMRLGNAFVSALERELVRAITNAGIRAHSESSAPAGTFKTGLFAGYCMQDTAGSPASDVGFHLKDDRFAVRVVFNIREVPVSAVTVDVKTRLRSGMPSEDLTTIANQEAKIVADKLVRELLVPAYRKRGWMI